MSYVHDLCRMRLIALQAIWLRTRAQSGNGSALTEAAIAAMSREQLTASILADREKENR